MKALANLITSIVTAPFRLLGRLVGFGDSEDFDQIYFTAGRADLAPPEREKLAKIADALVMRPNLALTIHGVTNAEADGRALREAALRARLDTRVGDEDAAGRLKIVQSMAKESIPGHRSGGAARAVHAAARAGCRGRVRRNRVSEGAGRETGRRRAAAGRRSGRSGDATRGGSARRTRPETRRSMRRASRDGDIQEVKPAKERTAADEARANGALEARSHGRRARKIAHRLRNHTADVVRTRARRNRTGHRSEPHFLVGSCDRPREIVRRVS